MVAFSYLSCMALLIAIYSHGESNDWFSMGSLNNGHSHKNGWSLQIEGFHYCSLKSSRLPQNKLLDNSNR